MENLNTFLDEHTNWNLGSAWYRYGGGFFIFVAPTDGNYGQEFVDLANMPGDIQSTSFFFYIEDQGEWLPIVYGETVKEGLDSLNKMLNKDITNEELEKIRQAYDKLIEVSDNNYGLETELRKKEGSVLKNEK